MINIEGFGKRDLYHDFNLSIDRGITYLKGRNGSGKTTLLDCIAGLDMSYQGKISGNENWVYLNQQLYFSGRLFVSDFVNFIFQLSKIKDAKNYYFSKMKRYENEFAFNKLWDKKICYLSGGELKLLFFSVISCIERDVYIFDEPYAGVDTYGKKIMNQVLTELNASNKTILITSHEEDFLNELDGVKVIELDL